MSSSGEVTLTLSMTNLHDAIGNVSPKEAISRAADIAYIYAVLKVHQASIWGASYASMTIEATGGDTITVQLNFEIAADGTTSAGDRPIIPVEPRNWDHFVINWNRICADKPTCNNQGGETKTTYVGREYEWIMRMSLEGSTHDIDCRFPGTAPLIGGISA